jgi:hypothetical protein
MSEKDMASNTKWVIWKAKGNGNGNQSERRLQEIGVCIFQSTAETQACSKQGDGPGKKSSHTVKTKGIPESFLHFRSLKTVGVKG